MLEKLAHISMGLGFASIGLTVATWAREKGKSEQERAHAERFGNFVGLWAPTFFLLGIYMLKLKELGYDREAEKLADELKTLKEKVN
ncbi:MAG: hypothetical protein LAT75_01215 [Candidatus Cyclonatronum sp.]|uniref:hypothetical protein n=1 Tax=Cyclonatronum sp. TaxID=3024185 RepID=UPI0025BCFD08|nr:hypothetical protein [Cyclonatronum sp.]MCC5934078.1 hypothetical protein [Balneolales bacterium]MCH8485452.1 hypothetical protein [Cyclonatronum sp.]